METERVRIEVRSQGGHVGEQPSQRCGPCGMVIRRSIIDLAEKVDVELDPRGVAHGGHRLRVGCGEDNTGTSPELVPVGDLDRDGGRNGLRPVVAEPGG